jgi:hypothetical protein
MRIHAYPVAIVLLMTPLWLVGQTSSLPFSMPSGATSTFISGAPDPLNTGFIKVQADSDNTAPDAVATVQYRLNGILISEATLPASTPVTSRDQFFIEMGGNVTTAISIANPNSEPAKISFGFQDPEIRFRPIDVGVGSFILPPNSQISRFIPEAPFNWPAPYVGLMSVDSSAPVAITVLRGVINERSEFLMTTVLEGKAPPGTFGSVPVQPRVTAGFIPRFAAGGGWTTEIVLINENFVDFVFGRLEFVGPSGEPIAVTINGETNSGFDIFIERRDSVRIPVEGTGPETLAGYVRLIGLEHSARFKGFALYNYTRSGVTVSTTSLPMVQPSASARLFVNESALPETLETGVAISNPSSTAATALLELLDFNANPTGPAKSIQLPPFGQFAQFLTEIPEFKSIPIPFRGVLRVTTTSSAGVTVAGMRGHLNQRGDFVMSALLPAVGGDETSPVAQRIVPDIVRGSGYTTEIVLFNDRLAPSNGIITAVSSDGQPSTLLATSPE